ncbi:MAG: type II secretion system F family protein [Acidobacteriota bacterium]|nr:type II secretion system F family protein [Acidobacteriota bacterium]
MQLLFATLVFFIIVLIFGAIYAFAGREMDGDIVRGRLEAIEKGTPFVKNALNLDLIRDELLSSIPPFNKLLVRWSWPGRLRKFIAQAGMQVRPGKITLISAAIGLTTLEVTQIIYCNFLVAVAAGIPAAFLPLVFVAIKRARRMAAFERGFPDVIDLLSRSVRAGHSFASGLEIVSTELPDPVSTEFRITFDQQRFGLPLRDALMSLCDRVPSMDVRLFAIALLVQKETGGNLVEILDNLARVIRERFRITGEVKIRTAQGRFTAGILMALPIIMMLLLHVIDPEYANLLFVDRLGQLMLILAAVMQTLGAIIVWRIVKIKV